jgi:hypothetical protein
VGKSVWPAITNRYNYHPRFSPGSSGTAKVQRKQEIPLMPPLELPTNFTDEVVALVGRSGPEWLQALLTDQ